MENFVAFDLDNDLLMEIDEATIEDFQDLDENDWEDQIQSLEKYDLDIDEEV